MKKVSTTPNLALKALKIVLASKQGFICVIIIVIVIIGKIQIVALLDKKLGKHVAIFYNIIYLFLEKRCNVILHLVVASQEYQIYRVR